MEITWYGHACFRLRGREGTVITDPYQNASGYTLPRVRADIIAITNSHPNHSRRRGIRGQPLIVNGPGEYEIRGIFITGIATYPKKKGGVQDRNTVYLFEFGNLTVCHLGDLAQVPNQSQVEDLSDVDVLLIPVGGRCTITASQAAEVISLLEPRIVIPMHYRTKACKIPLDAVSKFLKEMGLKDLPPQESLKVTKSSLPEETQVVILEYRQ
ncbi:MAG: MBL fold metallo-hydrolase [Anaerolineae bacterium]